MSGTDERICIDGSEVVCDGKCENCVKYDIFNGALHDASNDIEECISSIKLSTNSRVKWSRVMGNVENKVIVHGLENALDRSCTATINIVSGTIIIDVEKPICW